jgi:glutamate/tyrosine decarboxylase-like PLP-dependent enzyme
MYSMLQDASKRAIRYLADVRERAVAPKLEAVGRLDELDTELPEHPQDPVEVIALLDTIGSPATVATAGGRFFGFVVGGSLPAAIAANWLATAWDQNSSFAALSPGVATLEETSLRWLLDVLSLPPTSGGSFVTGATMANFTALSAARHAVLEKAGWDVESDGLFDAPPVTVVVSEEAHPSVIKALWLLGFGREKPISVPTDAQGRMRADALPRTSGPAIVCIQAGNINTGATDPAAEICTVAREVDAWVHVDGAFGLWAAAAPGRAHLVEDISEADSWATDAHKWLNVPYDSGLAIVRDPDQLKAAMAIDAPYLLYGARRDPSTYTPELSRRARGVEVWAALRSLGRSGLADLVERTCRYATRFADGLSEAGYEVLNDVVLNQVLVSFGDADATDRVVAGIQADGTCWCGATTWQGRRAMRISVTSWATTEDDVERSLAAMLRIAAREAGRATR